MARTRVVVKDKIRDRGNGLSCFKTDLSVLSRSIEIQVLVLNTNTNTPVLKSQNTNTKSI